MGNTIQQPPQLIDSANIRQEDVYDAISDPGDDGGPSTYESPLESGFSYPPEDLPVVTNGYPTSVGPYDSQAKFALYSQFPNGSANGYGAIRNYSDHSLLLGEGTVLRPPVVQEKPQSHISPPPHPGIHHQSHHHHHHNHLHPHLHHHPQSPPILPPPHHPPPSHLMPPVLPPPPPLLLPSSPPLISARESPVPDPLSQPAATSKKTSSPEIKLKIIKTYQNGRELFESSLCGDLLQELQAGEASRRRHEQKKEKRKKRASRQGDPDYEIGDLVWAKVGTYPWWPCMVSSDPQLKVHTRINTRGKQGHREYHVQFFGSVPERAWIHEKRVVVYQGRSQFEDLQADTLKKCTNPTEKQKLLKPQSQRERSQWEVGVGHAESALLMSREERNENYTFIYVDKEPSNGAGSPGSAKVAKPERKPRRSRSGPDRAAAPLRGTWFVRWVLWPGRQVTVESFTCCGALTRTLSMGLIPSPTSAALQKCESFGEVLVCCEGDCSRPLHPECLGGEGELVCQECKTGSHPCFSCKAAEGEVKRCSVAGCGRFYHEPCARKHPGTSVDSRGLRCPQHSCATCCLEKDVHKASKGRMMRCIRCPVAYHTGDSCVAAGSVPITPHIIICSNHSGSRKNGHLCSPVNVGWCFVCARGKDGFLASLLTCLPQPDLSCHCSFVRPSEGISNLNFTLICLFSAFRWWPAEICNPRLVPSNIQSLKHDIGDFPVFFFGSHDYYWINQGRVFPYVESDKNFAEGQVGINKTFKKALEEAARRFQELKAQRETKEALEQERSSRRPPPYKLLKSNKPVGKVMVHVADLSEIPRCNCKPSDERPCSQDSQCLNRMLQYECHPQVCPAGDRCHNQCFSKRVYPETEVIKTEGRGWGLKSKQDLKKGDFVIEYVGELIDSEECRQRIRHANENHVTNFYMLTLTKDRVIDAGPKGNLSRFMNHSCSPNCETQKWTVNGDVRIGLFTLCDIPADTELTFNYNLDCLGNGRTTCHCGAENCSGFLGVRPKSAVVMEREEKVRNAKLKPKKRRLKPDSKQVHEYYCFCCGEGGELVMCDKKDCPKAYHLLCLNLTKPPYGRWECPWHQCSVCQRAASAYCDFCPTSYCREHERGGLVPSALDARPCCSKHNPDQPLELLTQAELHVKEEQPEEAGEWAPVMCV
uniref:Nuclear receptor binding SET domain protein 3 n=1 Tax=Denticeps clupeoides TaxID=299321 RepID=A0AAY4AMH2_9TELE